MTAQAVILTSSSVVLAADSAVTIGGSSGERVYNGVEKVHALSDRDPIAALVYGSATIVGVPWATLLHLFKASVDISALPADQVTLQLAAFVQGQLAEHLKDSERLEQLKASRADIVLRAATDFAASLVEESLGAEDPPRSLNELDASERIERILEQANEVVSLELARWREEDDVVIPGAPPADALRDEHRGWALALASDMYEGTDASEDLIANSAELILESFTRTVPATVSSPWFGGVVVAGFGAGELWPGFLELRFDGVGLEGVRLWGGVSTTLTPGDGAIVQTFAQNAGAQTLMGGAHPTLLNMFGNEMLRAGLDSDAVDEVMERVFEAWFQEHTTSVLDTLDLLPTPALCEIAESFVALTALEHRLKGSLETVGGTISVGVLTPGDPLRWAKRPSLMSS